MDQTSMDVLPFSLSCDRCSFRTKSMSAMRQHAETHSDQSEELGAEHVQEEGPTSSNSNDAFQALVDSALNDASRILQSSQSDQQVTPCDASSGNQVEDVGRTDGETGRMLTADGQTQQRFSGGMPQSTAHGDSLAAEELLGIYAAGIDFSMVGENVVAGNPGHERSGNQQESDAVGLHGTTICVGSGISTVGSPRKTLHHTASSRKKQGSEKVRTLDQPSSEPSTTPEGEGSAAQERTKQAISSSQRENDRELSKDSNPERVDKDQSDNSNIERKLHSNDLRKEQPEETARPLFQFVIHRSAFSKTNLPTDDKDATPPQNSCQISSQSSSMNASNNSSANPEPAQSFTKLMPLMDGTPPSDFMPEREKGMSKNVRPVRHSRGRSAKNAPLDEEVKHVPMSKRRKMVSPVKANAAQGISRTMRRGRVGSPPSTSQTRNNSQKGDRKDARYKCSECKFTCKLKKILTDHTIDVHAEEDQHFSDDGDMVDTDSEGQSVGKEMSSNEGQSPVQEESTKRHKSSRIAKSASQTSKVDQKVGRKRARYKCSKCQFSCEYKKFLTEHALVHSDDGNRRNSRRKGSTRTLNKDINDLEAVLEGERSPDKQGITKSRKRTTRTSIKKNNNSKAHSKSAKPKQACRTQLQKVQLSERPTMYKSDQGKKGRRKRSQSDCIESKDDGELKKRVVSTCASDEDEDTEGSVSLGDDDDEDCFCNICGKFVAENPRQLKRHVEEKHQNVCKTSSKRSTRKPAKQLKCESCDYTCGLRKTLATHIKNSHSKIPTDKELTEQDSIEPEQKPKRKGHLVPDIDRTYRCNLCAFSCPASHLLNSHMKSQHNFEKMSGEFKCNVCGKLVVGRYSHFRRHLRCHSDERPYKCDQCPLAFRDANSLNCHKPIHKEERDYLCEDCGMAFKRPINLRMHRKVHTEKTFACDECDYKCRRRNTLQNHQRRKHLKQKSVLCQHCGHRFFSKTECKNHVLKKHTPRPTPFSCPICPAVFMFQYRFKAHLKTHPEIKPYKCEYCGFETRLNSYLMDHMRQHTGEKPKKCDLCDYQTSTNSNLYKHKKRHHGPGIPRPSKAKKSCVSDAGMGANGGSSSTTRKGTAPSKVRLDKGVVEEIVNAVEFGPFGQLTSQMALGASQATAICNMPPLICGQELKQEQIMQVVPIEIHQSPHALATEVVQSCPISEATHDAERLSISIMDKTSSSVAAMMEALAEARNIGNVRPQPLQQPSPQLTTMHAINSFPYHLYPTPEVATSSGSVAAFNISSTTAGGVAQTQSGATCGVVVHTPSSNGVTLQSGSGITLQTGYQPTTNNMNLHYMHPGNITNIGISNIGIGSVGSGSNVSIGNVASGSNIIRVGGSGSNISIGNIASGSNNTRSGGSGSHIGGGVSTVSQGGGALQNAPYMHLSSLVGEVPSHAPLPPHTQPHTTQNHIPVMPSPLIQGQASAPPVHHFTNLNGVAVRFFH